jgi:hypothetical protein
MRPWGYVSLLFALLVYSSLLYCMADPALPGFARIVDACDKCGRSVSPENDAVLLQIFIKREWIGLLFGPRRHLLPVVENGTVVCEGSPSRAQYLEGQPRDTRPGSLYDQSMEARVRTAYAHVLRNARLRAGNA